MTAAKVDLKSTCGCLGLHALQRATVLWMQNESDSHFFSNPFAKASTQAIRFGYCIHALENGGDHVAAIVAV
jgi:hypothetical protein